MKKRLSTLMGLILIIIPFISGAYNFTISGTVTKAGTGEPVANQMVTMVCLDSVNFGYATAVITNFNGTYSSEFDIDEGLNLPFIVSTMDFCLNVGYQSQMVYSIVEDAIVDFSICATGDSTYNCYTAFDYFIADSAITIPEIVTLHFIDYSYPEPVNWLWDFGDGTTSNIQNPVHAYNMIFDPNGNFYTACLTTTTADGCTNTLCLPIYLWQDTIISPDCYANFSYYFNSDSITDPTTNLPPYSVSFLDYSYPVPQTWAWDFGDGTGSTDQNPVHTFASQGIYNVCLSIQGDSCSNTMCLPLYIGNTDSIFEPECQAMFYTYFNDSIITYVEGYPMSFVDMSFGDPISWLWSFGDGATSYERYPMHIYENEGMYDVSLSIVTSSGCESSVNMPIWVWNYYDDSTNNMNCMANFYSIRDTMVNCLCYRFYDQSQGDVNSWFWEFGDGETSTLQNPMHTFTDASFWVTLNITTTDSCYSSITQWIGYNDSIWVGPENFIIDTLWMPLDSCFLSYEIPVDSAHITDFHLIDSSQVEVTWTFYQGVVVSIATIIYPYNMEGVNLFYLTISCDNGNMKGGNVITVSDQIVIRYSMLSIDKITHRMDNLDVFPNPVNDKLNISFRMEKNYDVEISILNITGQKLISFNQKGIAGNNLIQIITSELPQGVYFVRVESEKNTTSVKFIK